MATANALSESIANPSSRFDPRAGKYLTFQLDREEFAVGVLQVREIIGLQDITNVPGTPAHVKGVINLRGKVIPVVCLRTKFGLTEREYTSRSCVIVVQIKQATGFMQLGLIVDSVSDVLNIVTDEIEDTPDFGDSTPTPHLLGVAKVKGRVKILLDVDQIAGSKDWPTGYSLQA